MNSFGKIIVSSLIVFLFPFFLSIFVLPPVVDDIKVFQEEGKPNVMRLYKPGMDEIFVENPEKQGEYIGSNTYLVKNIKDKADRGVEEARIKKLVKWYD